MVVPAPILIPTSPGTADRTDYIFTRRVPDFGEVSKQMQLAPVNGFDENLRRAGFPDQLTPGTSSGNGVDLQVDTGSASTFDFTLAGGVGQYDGTMKRGGSDNDWLQSTKGISSFDPRTGTWEFSILLMLDNFISGFDSVLVGWGNTSTNNNRSFVGLQAFLHAPPSIQLIAFDAGGGFSSAVVATIVSGTWYYIRAWSPNTSIFCQVYDFTNEALMPAGGLAIPSGVTCDRFFVGSINDGNSASVDFHMRDFAAFNIPITYPIDQPVETFQQVDSGTGDSTWDMSSISIDGTDKEFRYAFGNADSPTNWSAWLSLTNLQAESDPSGRYFRLQVRPDHTAGTQQTYVTDGTINLTAAIVAPNPPTIAFVSRASGQFTISVDGDAGVTHQLLYRISGAWIEGGTRVGDGNITQTGLTDGEVYQVQVHSE